MGREGRDELEAISLTSLVAEQGEETWWWKRNNGCIMLSSLPRRASFPRQGNKARPRIQLWTYLPTFSPSWREKKEGKSKNEEEKIVKRAVAPMARERERFNYEGEEKVSSSSFFFFLYEIIIVKSLKYSRAGHIWTRIEARLTSEKASKKWAIGPQGGRRREKRNKVFGELTDSSLAWKTLENPDTTVVDIRSILDKTSGGA